MQTRKTIQCPYCFESVEIDIPPTEAGTMVRDCEVCCNPLRLHVERGSAHSPRGRVRLRVRRAQ